MAPTVIHRACTKDSTVNEVSRTSHQSTYCLWTKLPRPCMVLDRPGPATLEPHIAPIMTQMLAQGDCMNSLITVQNTHQVHSSAVASAPKSVTSAFPFGITTLLHACDIATKADLPQIWGRLLANAKKKNGAVLDKCLRETSTSVGLRLQWSSWNTSRVSVSIPLTRTTLRTASPSFQPSWTTSAQAPMPKGMPMPTTCAMEETELLCWLSFHVVGAMDQ